MLQSAGVELFVVFLRNPAEGVGYLFAPTGNECPFYGEQKHRVHSQFAAARPRGEYAGGYHAWGACQQGATKRTC